jgi:predicted nucleic acid-binding protein
VNAVVDQGLIDTNIIVLRHKIDSEKLPTQMGVSAITLAELSAGVHQVSDVYGDVISERARRLELLQRTEHEFDPLPFDAEAARKYGQLVASVLIINRSPRRRIADLMIAATAAANNLPLFTTNPDDYQGLEELLDVIPVVP